MYTVLRKLVLKSGNANDKFISRTRAIYNITKETYEQLYSRNGQIYEARTYYGRNHQQQ